MVNLKFDYIEMGRKFVGDECLTCPIKYTLPIAWLKELNKLLHFKIYPVTRIFIKTSKKEVSIQIRTKKKRK